MSKIKIKHRYPDCLTQEEMAEKFEKILAACEGVSHREDAPLEDRVSYRLGMIKAIVKSALGIPQF